MSARLTREHNDTNMMALGAGATGEKLALEIVDTWLDHRILPRRPPSSAASDKLMALETE